MTTNRLNIRPPLSYHDLTCLCRQCRSIAVTTSSDATTVDVWGECGDAMEMKNVLMDRMRRDVVSNHPLRGFTKLKQSKKRWLEVGGWVQVSLGFCFVGKSSQNSPIPVGLLFLDGMYHVHFVLKYVIQPLELSQMIVNMSESSAVWHRLRQK